MSTVALKRVCDLITDLGPEQERPYVALEHVVSGTGTLGKDIELPRRGPAAGLAAVSPGDVLFGKLRPYLAKTLLVSEPMFASTELMALRPASSVDSRWLHYLVMSDRIVGWAVATSDGSKMPRTSWSALGEYRVTVPDPSSQRAIADFLDAETARIDALIAKKQRLISLLAARQEVLVRKEFDGVDLVLPLRRILSRIQTGMTPTKRILEHPHGSGIEWFTPADLGSGLVVRPSERRLDAMALQEGAAPRFPADSVLVVGIGATAGRVGYLNREGSGNQQITCLVPSELIPARLLAWQLAIRADELRSTAPYTTLPILNNDFLMSLPVRVPPRDRSQKILQRLDKAAAEATAIGHRISHQLKLVTEHRQALITAAVTGRIEVPGVAAS